MLSARICSNFIKLGRRLSHAVFNSKTKDSSKRKQNIDFESVQPYEDIPGPKSLPIIGNTFRFIPKFGKYDGQNIEKMLLQLHEEYGDIVKLDGILLKRPMILVFSPSLFETMYKTEGNSPMRTPIECVTYYTKLNGLKNSLGNGQGKEWREFRSKVNQPMLKPQMVSHHVKKIEIVANEFIEKIRVMRDPKSYEMPANFNNELYKWSLEAICLIFLDHRLGCLNENFRSNYESQQMIDAVHVMFDSMYKLERLPLWKIFGNSPQLKRFCNAVDTVTNFTSKYVDNAMQRLKNTPEYNKHDYSMLERLLLSSDEETAKLMARDMIGGGVDTVSNTIGKMLYAIATHSQVQEKLFIELEAVLPNVNTPLTEETMKSIPFLQACLKETMRLYSPTIGSPRTMQKDVVLAGYKIPKGLDVLAVHGVICQKPEEFPEPQRFIPERWLRAGSSCNVRSANEAHPFAFLPFGIGPRSCVAKRLAEHEILIIVAKIIRNFQIGWEYDPLRVKYQIISTIMTDLKFKMLDR